ncbi:hypothetical protein ACWTCY_00775 [Anaerostipes caccae]|uniref:hypothetical protein n=2 Tax=Anaerostipes caccae TaxID=105841 RepID=UPI001A92A46A|nr:hypothetical protein [Anaerostipes caccae]MCB6606788.1 hypothetical protein [Anaerostipes caccae]MCQ4985586.1 hypothetical protein [Anaerostipes caccae]
MYQIEFVENVLLSGGTPKMEGSIIVLILNVILILGFAPLLKKEVIDLQVIKLKIKYCKRRVYGINLYTLFLFIFEKKDLLKMADILLLEQQYLMSNNVILEKIKIINFKDCTELYLGIVKLLKVYLFHWYKMDITEKN